MKDDMDSDYQHLVIKRAIEEQQSRRDRQEFWKAAGNVALWLLSVVLILALFSAGGWLPQLLVKFGFSA